MFLLDVVSTYRVDSTRALATVAIATLIVLLILIWKKK